jgi:hypothetical protein
MQFSMVVGGLCVLVRVALASVFFAGVLGSCSAIDSTLAPRYDTTSRSLAQARNESILLNIVRAGHDYPLSFSTVSQAIPQMSNTTTIGLPQFLVGPNPKCVNLANGALGAAGAAACLAVPPSPVRDVVFGNSNQASNGTNVQTQFTLSTQETHDFYNALLRPVDLYILNFFIRQGYSRELLFWLFADSVEITIAGHTIGYQYNPPFDAGCPVDDRKGRCFRDWAELATIAGLTVEEQTSKPEESGGDSGKDKDKDNKDKNQKASGAGGKGTVVSRLCFSGVLQRQGILAMKRVHPERLELLKVKFPDPNLFRTLYPQCGRGPWQTDPNAAVSDTLTFRVGSLQFRIEPRSAYGIYQFLGKLLKLSKDGFQLDESQLPQSIDEASPDLSTVLDDNRLLNIVVNDGGPCFVETQFYDGHYCVPEKGSANTKRIFGLLAQLIALQTTAADLAITPTVHTVQ